MTVGYNRALSAAARTNVQAGSDGQLYRQAGQLAGQAAQYVVNRDAEIRARQEGVERVQIRGQYDQGVASRTANLDPLAPDYMDQVAQAHADTLAELQDQIANHSEDSQAALQQSFLQSEASLNVSAIELRNQAVREDAATTVAQERESILANIANDPDGYDQYVDAFGGVMADAGEVFTELERKALAEKFANDAVAAKAEGLANAGDFDQARAWVKENESLLSRGQVASINSGINAEESRQRTEFARATARQLADLQIAVTTAETVDDLARADQAIQQADRMGLFANREGARANLVAQLHNVRKSLVKAARSQSAFAERMVAGDVVRSDQEAETAWAMIEQEQAELFAAEPTRRLEHLQNFAQFHGRVPPQVRTAIERAERMGDPQSLASAALFAQTLEDAGITNTYAGPHTDSTMFVSDALGITLSEAAAFVAAESFDEDRRKANEKALKEAAPSDYAPTQWLADELGVDIDQIPMSMGDQFGKAVQVRFMMTGDFDLATGAAMKQIEKRFNATQVGDPGRYQRFPPENFLQGPIIGFDQKSRAKFVDQDVREFLSAVPMRGARTTPDKVRYRLTADDQTEREIGLSVAPSYILSVESEAEGVFVPIANSDTGLPLRFRLPDAEQAKTSPYVQDLIKSSLPAGRAETKLRRQMESDDALGAVRPEFR